MLYVDKILEHRAERFNKHISFAGKKILDIGCGQGDLVKFLATHYKIEHATGIDLSLSSWWGIEASEGENWNVQDGDAEHLPFEDSSFDAIVSVATFEHIQNIPKALSEIKRVLKPFGRFCTEFSPIWTSILGHHWSKFDNDGLYWREECLKLIPPWGHLYMDETQMRVHLKEQITDNELIEDAIAFIYHGNLINRKSKKEITSAIMNVGMIVKEYYESISFNRFMWVNGNEAVKVTNELSEKIKSAGYDATDIGIVGIFVCLEKYANL